MKKSCLYFDKKYKCASFIVHYKGLTLNSLLHNICAANFIKENVMKISYSTIVL